MIKIPNNARWIVLCSATAINFISGILYAWSVIGKELINIGWTAKQASLPYTVATISYVIAMVISGKIQDLKGPRSSVIVAGALMGGGLILSGFVSNAFIIACTFGVITGAGIGITAVAMISTAMKWFEPEKRGLINGIVVGGVGIAPVFFSPASNFLIKYTDVSNTFIVLGIFSLAVVLPLSIFITNPSSGYGTGLSGDPKAPEKDKSTIPENAASNDMTRSQMLRTFNFYKLWIILAFSSSAGLMIISHAAHMAKVQANWEGGYLLVILIAVFNASGRLLGGFLSDKIGRLNILMIIFLTQAVNMLLFSHYNSILLLAGGIVIAGMCYGATFAVFAPTVSDFYGMKNFSSVYSTIFTAWGVAGMIGPMMAAAILDNTGSYNGAYMAAGCLLVISLLVTLTLKKA